MKILAVCDEGNNRSVTVAHQLKYWGHDVIAVGINRNGMMTLAMLVDWADRIIVTDQFQEGKLPMTPDDRAKVQLWDIGPDIYPRPMNKELLFKVKALMALHQSEYKP